jgi:hypothetical protein
MSSSVPSGSAPKPLWRDALLMAMCLLVLLAFLFANSFKEGQTLFSNDGPLGAISSQKAELPGNFFAMWEDLNSVGYPGINAPPGITGLLYWQLGALHFSKFYAPICLFILGMSAWLFFRTLGLRQFVGLMSGLAATMHTNTFSNACWGLPTRALTLAMALLALAALVSGTRGKPWLKAALAGLAIGMGVSEGFDVGALFSIYLAAFAFFLPLLEGRGFSPATLAKSVGQVAVMSVFAGYLATNVLSTLIGTQIVGVSSSKQTSAERWNFATQWSMPKTELLRVIIPGVFGYRMDTPGGGQYWGACGQDPLYLAAKEKLSNPDAAVRQQAQAELAVRFPRHSGSGEYAGVLVVLLAIYGACQAFRKIACPYSPLEKSIARFWAAAAVISLLLAFGRHAPFYQLIYPLPYFSTIRNPMKFMHHFQLALLVLFGLGLQALWRCHFEQAREAAGSIVEHFKKWWGMAKGFDRNWVLGCVAAIGASLLGWLVFSASRRGVEGYLRSEGFGDPANNTTGMADLATQIASRSLGEVALYVLFMALSIALVTLAVSGALAGRRSRIFQFLFCAVLLVDLYRANKPWILYYDYREKLASNPIIDILKTNPWEHRVTIPRWQVPQQYQFFPAMCNEWLQAQFQYYNVQSLDIVQLPRMPEDIENFQYKRLGGMPLRLWELTNTRYLLTMLPYVDAVNRELDPVQRRFRLHTAFGVAPKPGLTTANRIEDLAIVPQTNGPFALVEFAGALPRAKLYSNWKSGLIKTQALEMLADPAFNPAETVLVEGTLPPPSATNGAAGDVRHTFYSPKLIRLEANASTTCVLLLNGKHDPNWKVFVDGQPQPLLRCNYLMRGVQLASGRHQIEFRFEPAKASTFYVSLSAIAVGILLCGFLAISKGESMPAPEPAPASQPAPTPQRPRKGK